MQDARHPLTIGLLFEIEQSLSTVAQPPVLQKGMSPTPTLTQSVSCFISLSIQHLPLSFPLSLCLSLFICFSPSLTHLVISLFDHICVCFSLSLCPPPPSTHRRLCLLLHVFLILPPLCNISAHSGSQLMGLLGLSQPLCFSHLVLHCLGLHKQPPSLRISLPGSSSPISSLGFCSLCGFKLSRSPNFSPPVTPTPSFVTAMPATNGNPFSPAKKTSL